MSRYDEWAKAAALGGVNRRLYPDGRLNEGYAENEAVSRTYGESPAEQCEDVRPDRSPRFVLQQEAARANRMAQSLTENAHRMLREAAECSALAGQYAAAAEKLA